MKFTAKEVVRGISNMQYNIDGQTAQVKCLHIDVELTQEHGGRGTRTDAKQVESAEVISEAFDSVPGQMGPVQFPVICELDFVEKATRGKTSLVIVAIRPQHKAPASVGGDQRKAA